MNPALDEVIATGPRQLRPGEVESRPRLPEVPPRGVLPGSVNPTAGRSDDGLTLVDRFLDEQRTLTAVERFSRRHSGDGIPASQKFYRDLIPLTTPRPGEQFAFEVDLDKCSGCKACVSACHSLNGLDEHETWRSVGLLIDSRDPFGPRTSNSGFHQHLTAACHHCVEPACLSGCPVLAYEKDPVTGIVRHLDDQCIGCQYCIFKCPYDVPKYSARRGIVRKCDLCSSRLDAGEAPACVQACPNAAIRITIVSQTEIGTRLQDPSLPLAARASATWVPGAPDPTDTLPTTRYVSKRPLPKHLTAANQHQLRPEHPHSPLVVMLVLTQLSVGAFSLDTLLRAVFPGNLIMRLSPFHALTAFGIGLIALLASTLHLGRPLYAWRALLGLRQSWLSREMVVFGLFAVLAMVAAGSRFSSRLGLAPAAIGLAVSVTGLLGVLCSAMIYHDTPRPFWKRPATTWKFLGTTALLGAATILFLTTLQAWLAPEIAGNGAYQQLTRWLTVVLALVGLTKLAWEAAALRHRRDHETTPLKAAARLMTGELAEITTARFLAGLIGAVILPLAFLDRRPAPGFATLGMTLWILLFSLLGELLERRLFFAAAVAPRMPGGIGA